MREQSFNIYLIALVGRPLTDMVVVTNAIDRIKSPPIASALSTFRESSTAHMSSASSTAPSPSVPTSVSVGPRPLRTTLSVLRMLACLMIVRSPSAPIAVVSRRKGFYRGKRKLTHLEMGHTSRGCKEERAIIERVEVKCVNCNEPGHRARDCTQPRRDRYGCRNCGYVNGSCVTVSTDPSRSSEHKAAECDKPRSAEGVECKRCGESEFVRISCLLILTIDSGSLCEGLSAGTTS